MAPRDAAIQADSLPFTVLPGDTVLVTFYRPKEDVSPGEIGILRISGILFKT
jgi:SOS-response transcriptional repressor LexA